MNEQVERLVSAIAFGEQSIAYWETTVKMWKEERNKLILEDTGQVIDFPKERSHKDKVEEQMNNKKKEKV